MLMTQLLNYGRRGVVPSPLDRVAVTESVNRYNDRDYQKCCGFWVMRLNTSKTKTMIVSMSRTMHSQSSTLTL